MKRLIASLVLLGVSSLASAQRILLHQIDGSTEAAPYTACSATDLATQGGSAYMICVARSAVNVGTATALAANGTNCSAGEAPRGVDASGNAESCTAYQEGPLSGDVVTSGAVATIQANSVALTTDTTGSYAAGDAEAGAALTGDSATAFFSAGAIEAARGGTAIDSSGSTGVAQVAAGTWSVSNNVDLATGTWQTGADSVVSYSPVECIKGTDPIAGLSWQASLSSGHYTISLAAGATSGAPFGCNLTVPSSLAGVAVKVREVVLYYALTGTGNFDETTLYVETVSAGTFVDVERHTVDITSGTSYTYTGVPVTLAAGETLQVSGIGKTPVGSTITLRGFKVTYDTD